MKLNLKSIAVGLLVAAAGAALGQGIQVKIDGHSVGFHGQQPTMTGDRVLVPLRGVLERMGAIVNWGPDPDTFTANKAGMAIELKIGDRSALVNGQTVTLDVPAQIIHDSTMVPLRFLSEALGQRVDWNGQEATVEIFTNGDGVAASEYRAPAQDKNSNRSERFADTVLSAGTVIPVRLREPLSSDSSYRGQRFTAKVAPGTSYLPAGTTIEGTVEGSSARSGSRPGLLELSFDRIVFPGGGGFAIKGTISGLDEDSVYRRDGRLYARRPGVSRSAWVGYGAGLGSIAGLPGDAPVEKTRMDSLFGYGIGSVDRAHPHNVSLHAGTLIGVRLSAEARSGD